VRENSAAVSYYNTIAVVVTMAVAMAVVVVVVVMVDKQQA
jgi:hypothetical protein